jgi:IS30 family transposase
LPRATACATQKAAVRRLKPFGNFVHTITFDNGKEFAAHQDIAHALKAKIFFATPYHAWERGLNENTNGLTLRARLESNGGLLARVSAQ